MDRIPVSQPYQWGNEIVYVTKAMRDNWISSSGEYIDRFEADFAKYCKVRHGIACMNGTVACHLAFAAAGIGSGDEVICPDFTMMAPVFSLLYLGAKPIFVDSDERSWTIDVSKIEEKITSKTKAILAVHIYGHPCDMDAIHRIAKKYQLTVLEDAAEAHGAECLVNGEWRQAGSLSKTAAFSFYANKNITTGEGGMVVTDDDAVAGRLRSLKNLCLGKTNETRFIHEGVGYQYRMTNLQAAIGCAQMEHADDAKNAKITIGKKYNKLLKDIPGLTLPPECAWARNVYWVYGIRIEDDFGMTRQDVQKKLASAGIETRSFFYPTHKQKMFSELSSDNYEVSCKLWDRGFYIPSYIGMEDGAIERVADTLGKIQKRLL
ncbi:MAG: DegT/DnrJ/EryC1/StrS family aminotransferase [Planctomycetota bacterium]